MALKVALLLLAISLSDLILCRAKRIVPIPEDIKDEIRSRVASGENPSIAFATYENGQSDVFVHGWQDLEKRIPATEETLYGIASITKTVVGLLMGKLFVERKIKLWDPADMYLGRCKGLRQADGTPIELLHLATHTSGLPLEADNFDPEKPWEYGPGHLSNFLGRYQVEDVGDRYSYSNIGFGILGDCLAAAQADGREVKQLLREEILEPLNLGMKYHSELTPEESLKMAEGYKLTVDHDGDLYQAVHPYAYLQDTLAGAAGLVSNITDLLRWGVVQLPDNQEGGRELREAVEMAGQRYYAQFSPNVSLGLAWNWDGPVITKLGQWKGFMSEVTVNRKTGQVVVLATNTEATVTNPVDLTLRLVPFNPELVEVEFEAYPLERLK